MRFALVFLAAVGCGSGGMARPDGGMVDEPDAAGLPMTEGAGRWRDVVQPLIAAECGSCHLGTRFAWASLRRAGNEFTEAETAANYYDFLDQISLDAPQHSRLLAKAVGPEDVAGMMHAGGAVIARDDETWTAFFSWIQLEKGERCNECGITAPRSYLAYVEQPRLFWALEPDPIRTDHGLRDRARIFLQPLGAGTLTPEGEPIDFLGDAFCGTNGCDFGNLSVSHDGARMAFECRLSFGLDDGPLDPRWNVCIAEIGADGRAVNPRFLMPASRQHFGDESARSDPYGLTTASGEPLKGPYDLHFQTRRRSDRTPVFSPDDSEVVLASQGPDPRTGEYSYQTYHGFEALDHIVAVNVETGAIRTIYRNEGGVADFPFYLRNGNVVFHTWNLERMDRHLYTQSRHDGMGEVPVFLGRSQGPNMWGKATQIANGSVLGMTGRRRSSIENYVVFAGDHTLGLGLDAALEPIRIFDSAVFEQVQDFPTGYCDARTNPEGPSCVVDRFYADVAWAPDGRALIAYSPERTYVLQGEDMYLGYANGSTLEEQLASMEPYLPRRLGIAAIDHRGQVQTILEPPADKMYRFPAWVGRRSQERRQPSRTDENAGHADLHIADVPLWLSFRDNTGDTDRTAFLAALDEIVAIRVLVKEADGNACLNDGRPYRFSVNAGAHDHPTHLGINNATGYVRLAVPASAGGDAFGDVPLRADRSVNLRVPAGELLLVQGIDADGHVVRQQSRVFALPPGQTIDTSVRRDQYASQCASCHGAVGAPFVPLGAQDQVQLVDLDYATEAKGAAPVDLTVAERRPATFLHAIRPVLDAKCVSCHSGSAPAGELSLEATYSPTANFPAGRWATQPGLADPAYMATVPPAQRVPGYNYSVTWAWLMHEDETEYRTSSEYASLIASQAPLGAMASWDPAYQNLFAHDNSRWIYLGGYFTPNFGRGDRVGGVSQDAWLLEILTGEDLDPARTYTGAVAHEGMMSDVELRELKAVIDVGWPFMLRCDDRTVPSGPNAGTPWGQP